MVGLAELIAPRQFSRLLGIPPDDSSERIARAMGIREIVGSGVLLVSPNPVVLWMRVPGDALDLSLLARGLDRPGARRGRIVAAMGAVVGASVLDVVAAVLATRGASRTKHGAEQTVEGGARLITRSITIDRPRGEVYRFWHDFENLPRFMAHLESVRVINERRSQWRAKAPLRGSVEWEAVIVEDRPDELIAWESVAGSRIENAGSVRFDPAPGDRGTEVALKLRYTPPLGGLGATVARAFGEEPSQQTAEDLRRFKQVLETGEVVLSEAALEGGRLPFTQRPAQPATDPATTAS